MKDGIGPNVDQGFVARLQRWRCWSSAGSSSNLQDLASNPGLLVAHNPICRIWLVILGLLLAQHLICRIWQVLLIIWVAKDSEGPFLWTA